jgi:C1A family cysteine protease
MPAISVMPKVGGYLPDPFDRSDKRMKLIRNSLKDMAVTSGEHIIQEYTPISEQLNLSSCVANACADALEILLGLERHGNSTQLSRLFIYWIARSFSGDHKRDAGSYIRIAAQQMMKLGVPPEKYWPYNISRVFTSPTLEAFNIASDNTINGMYRIDSVMDDRVEDVETAIQANHPVVFGTVVGTDFQAYRGGGDAFGPTLHEVGRHAMILTGVRHRADGQREFLVRNSWGDGWGDQGHAWMNEGYIEWSETQDLWVFTRMQELVV